MSKPKSKWIDISDVLTPTGAERLQIGQVLVFDYEGSRNEFKVMRKASGKVWVQPVTLYHPSQVRIVQKDKGDGDH